MAEKLSKEELKSLRKYTLNCNFGSLGDAVAIAVLYMFFIREFQGSSLFPNKKE